MAASANLSLLFVLGDYCDLPLAASATVYRHTAIGQVTGTNTFRALVAGDKFMGIAEDGAVYSSDAGAPNIVRTRHKGKILLSVTGATSSTAPGTSVYASADDTYTLTSTSNSLMGKLLAYDDTSTKYIVEFDAALV